MKTPELKTKQNWKLGTFIRSKSKTPKTWHPKENSQTAQSWENRIEDPLIIYKILKKTNGRLQKLIKKNQKTPSSPKKNALNSQNKMVKI